MANEELDNAERELAWLNGEITRWEQDRDPASVARLNDSLSAKLIFRRADRSVVGKEAFMGAFLASPFTDRDSRDVAVSIVGDRAIVTLVVRGTLANGTIGWYRNLRVFFRSDGRWQMEAWFNDDISSLVGH